MSRQAILRSHPQHIPAIGQVPPPVKTGGSVLGMRMWNPAAPMYPVKSMAARIKAASRALRFAVNWSSVAIPNRSPFSPMLLQGFERVGNQSDREAPTISQEWAVQIMADQPEQLAKSSHRPV